MILIFFNAIHSSAFQMDLRIWFLLGFKLLLAIFFRNWIKIILLFSWDNNHFIWSFQKLNCDYNGNNDNYSTPNSTSSNRRQTALFSCLLTIYLPTIIPLISAAIINLYRTKRANIAAIKKRTRCRFSPLQSNKSILLRKSVLKEA
jgi:hypothetical protein